jgi:hypothetical protein
VCLLAKKHTAICFVDKPDPKERKIEMKKRSCANIIQCLLLFAVMSMLLSGPLMTETQAMRTQKTKEGSMSLAFKIETESSKIPLIDAAVPSIFETASFGLG